MKQWKADVVRSVEGNEETLSLKQSGSAEGEKNAQATIGFRYIHKEA